MDYSPLWIALYIFGCLAAAAIAARRGKSALTALLFSILATPIVGLPVAAFWPKRA